MRVAPFTSLDPASYREIVRLALAEDVRWGDVTTEAGVPAELTGRPKHLWSIYHKMESRDLPYEEIYDLMAMRVLTDDVPNCYAALGVIHNEWTPVQERFHYFIATPKSNRYQSRHTTVSGPGGRRSEIQIRSHEMHRTAEYGIAAHWRYKEGITGAEPKSETEVDEALTWFRQVLDWQKDTSEPEEFMEFLRMDLFQGEIFVFTPKGEVKQLPTGATPIDFAYSVHTEIGNHCAGARVNGRISPLSRELKNGDAEEIINRSINQMLTRTIITSMTTLLVLTSLYFLGGESVSGFALALIIGVVVGTYSSIYIASASALALDVSPIDLQPPKREEIDSLP